MKYKYPEIRKSDLVEDRFGYKLKAPYTWLRDTKDPEVLDFTRRENEFTDQWFDEDEVNAMIEKLTAEHVPEHPFSISPWKDGYIATESHEGNYSIISLNENFEKTETLFKRYDLPERTPFGADPCPVNEDILAIMAQVDGAPRPDNIIYDFANSKIRKILPMTFSGVWSKKKEVFYSPSTKTEGSSSKTFIQKYDVKSDTLEEVFTFDGNAIFGSTYCSADGKMIIFSFAANYSQEYFFAYDEETGMITPINEESPLMIAYVDSIAGKHYFVSFEEDPHGKLITIPFGKDISASEIIYEEKEAFIESGFAVNGKIFLFKSKDGAARLYSLSDEKDVDFPDQIISLSLNGDDHNGKILAYDSFTSSPKLFSFDGRDVKTVLGKEENNDDLEVELLFAESVEDKTPIPYYLVHRKDARKDRNNRALIYGYGGYNASMPPWSTEAVSQTNIRSWVTNGGIYVHCLLRGGNEYGSTWHEQGMGLKKKNCYYDFIGIAEQIIADGWTKPEKIAISGCSNGGLLMSALVTMRPDLWGCVIDSVPHTDMIHFADDDRGPMYITEYGDPKGSKEEFEYLLSYSPVHNVKDVAYPAVYIQTGECDNNVPPYHGKSFAATLQEHNQSDNPILLRVLKLGSHDRGQGDVFWRTIAEMHVFMEKNLK